MLHLLRRASFGPTRSEAEVVRRMGLDAWIEAQLDPGRVDDLLGGGMRGGRVHGRWPGLAPGALDQGDLAGANDYRNVLAELLRARLGVADAKKIFPGLRPETVGVFR